MFQRGTFTVILFLKQQVAVSYISKKNLNWELIQRLFLPINELKSNMIKSPGLSHKTPSSSTSTQSKASEFSEKKKSPTQIKITKL